jgi:hypothetical protein
MNRPTPKSIKIFSIFIVTLFILAQLVITSVGNGGPWCSPSLTAPHDDGHPFYQFTGYGFPFPFVTVAREDCFQAQSTNYEWSPISLGVDGLLLILVAAPLWAGLLRRKPIN